MPDNFLSIPDHLMGDIITSQEALDWLAFGSPTAGSRNGLSIDDQILAAHKAAGALLMSIWSGDLPSYVRSPSLAIWYQVPSTYWGHRTPDEMRSAIERPEIPERLPGQPRPLDPRYGFNIETFPGSLPATDVIGQVIAFRKSEVERNCTIAGPVCEWNAAGGGEVQEVTEPDLPAGAKPNDYKHLKYARHAAKWLRENPGRPLSEALRDACQGEPQHNHNAIDKATRHAFSLIYDKAGWPLKNS